MSKKVSFFSDCFPKDSKWIEPGFYALCLTLFSMPFPRSWSLYPLGVTLFFGLIAWIKDFRVLRDLFLHKLMLVLPLIFYFLVHAVYLIFDNKPLNVSDKLIFILVPVLTFPIFISKYFTDRIRLLLIAYLAGILVITLFQFTRASCESISFVNGTFRFEPMIRPGISRFNWEQLSTFENPTYITIKAIWAFILVLYTNNYLKIRKVWQGLLIILYSIFIYFLAVRAGMLILGLLVIVFISGRLQTISRAMRFKHYPFFYGTKSSTNSRGLSDRLQ